MLRAFDLETRWRTFSSMSWVDRLGRPLRLPPRRRCCRARSVGRACAVCAGAACGGAGGGRASAGAPAREPGRRVRRGGLSMGGAGRGVRRVGRRGGGAAGSGVGSTPRGARFPIRAGAGRCGGLRAGRTGGARAGGVAGGRRCVGVRPNDRLGRDGRGLRAVLCRADGGQALAPHLMPEERAGLAIFLLSGLAGLAALWPPPR